MEIVEKGVGEKLLLLGNEAIARGGFEAGVDVVTSYPGTPSSEIADVFSGVAWDRIQRGVDPSFYFEYSTNEKVALEVAAAGSFSGLRTLCCMKHVGLNVASDAFMTVLYNGCSGGFVIVSADDPFCHSSQNEQDNRYYALMGNAPMFEPTSPQEAKEMTKSCFEVSEELQLPVLLRTTTRLNHARGIVTLEKMEKTHGKGFFEKDLSLSTVEVSARVKHPLLLEKMELAERISEKTPFNTTIDIGKPVDIGIVTSGVSYNYVIEMAEALDLNVKVLKLGMTNPIPKKMCEKLIKSCNTLVVVEELEPILEQQFKALAHDVGSKVKIYGKTSGHFPRVFEYTPDIIVDALSKISKVKNPFPKPVKTKLKLPSRPPALCPGCSHRATFYAAKKAAPKNTIYPSDIGCYILGKYPPLEAADVLLCMGSNAGVACGFAIASDQNVISFMGDSTFFHSGIPPIIDAVHNNHNCVITILDNRTTAMTGHQPHPGTEYDGMGRPAKLIKIEDMVRGIGVEHVEVVDPDNLLVTTAAFKRALEYKGPAVVISKSPCILRETRVKKESGEEIPVYYIDEEKCNQCKICIDQFGCPAFAVTDENNIHIDMDQCNGCGHCGQICPKDAIFKMERGR